ncbi:uncharacterized protein LOC134529750 isoform X1 [Bacillus rossius redtenbacheri]|uniref:uncharacterized protein LOC134529750 isoform X1 n=1 Tax=Bacillus rossius redtenbacheri TaxID=93214 RepID=UPI002FDEC559
MTMAIAGGVSWIYQLHREDLVLHLEENGLTVAPGETVVSMRSRLVQFVRESSASPPGDPPRQSPPDRTSLQLKKCWENMKMKKRKELAAESRYRMGTGGGHFILSKPAHDGAVPHLTENLGFLWDRDAVAVEEAAAVPEETAVEAVPHDPAPATSTAPVPQTSAQGNYLNIVLCLFSHFIQK